MISKICATTHLNRMLCLPSQAQADQRDQLIRELAVALQRAARNPEHAQLITDWVLMRSKWLPVPADIYELAETIDSQLYEDEEARHQQSKCKSCQGSGYRVGYWLVTWGERGRKLAPQELTPEQYREAFKSIDNKPGVQGLYSGVSLCECVAGQCVKAAQAEREAKKVAPTGAKSPSAAKSDCQGARPRLSMAVDAPPAL